jgi:putative ABC transport system permease protein
MFINYLRVAFRNLWRETLHYNAPPTPVIQNLLPEFPELESVVRVGLGDDWMVIRGDRTFRVDNVATADSNFFKVFDYTLLKGDPNTVLKYPNTVVLAESEAKKFFGNTNPIGQTLKMSRFKFTGTVTGLMKDMPENSHLNAHMIFSDVALDTNQTQNWDEYACNTYLLLKPGANAAALQAWLSSAVWDRTSRRSRLFAGVCNGQPVGYPQRNRCKGPGVR